MEVDERTKAIIERAKQRKVELEAEESKENYDETLSPILHNNSKVEHLSDQITTEQKPRRSAFAALAEEYDNFAQQSPPKTRVVTKEDYVKGKSPRLSIGETRPSVLCTPAGFAAVSRSPTKQNERNEAPHISMKISPLKPPQKSLGRTDMEESRHIRFAHPISATYYDESASTLNESSIVAGNFVDQSLRSLANSTAAGNESQECGAHLFIRKKTPSKTPSTASLQVCSPQPFNRSGSSSSFAHVSFNPSATSSPKTDESVIREEKETIEAINKPKSTEPLKTKKADVDRASELSTETEKKTLSPVRIAALESAAAKNVVHVLEERLKGTPHKNNIPVPKNYCTPAERSTPVSAIKTQWRGATSTPVVSGATPGEPTVPNVGGSNIKSLRNRWEFSSITGTPLHPDETEDALVQAALKMRDTSVPKRPVKKISVKYDTPVHATHISRSDTTSPSAKSPRCEYEAEKALLDAAAQAHGEDPHREPLENEDSGTNISKFIDDAFEFMGSSPNKTNLPVQDVSPANVKGFPDKEYSPLDKDASMNSTIKYDDDMKDKSRGAGLQYTISYYRKRARQEKIPDPNAEKIDLTMSYAGASSQQILGNTSVSEAVADIDEQKRRLKEVIYAQRTKISQASKALQLCKNKEQFRGSHEEATAQWAVLIETEILRAAESEIERINSHVSSSSCGPLGSLTISYLAVELNKDFIETYANIRSANIFYFCIILRSADKVLHSTIVSSEEAVKRGAIEIVQPLILKDLPTNFTASLDVYSYRSIRAQYTHEEKFGLKGTTTKIKSVRTSHHSPLSDSSFQLVGRLALDIHVSNGKKRLLLSDVRHPLDGHITIKIKKVAIGKSKTSRSGFLSMFQRTKEGLGSWNRYWCVLEEGGMKFWRRPEDEANQRNWLVLLDLQTCAGEKEGALEANEPCQYMHSFYIDVWVPKEGQDTETLNKTGRPEMEKLRVMLAADTKEDMRSWLEDINVTVKQLLTWNRPFAFAK